MKIKIRRSCFETNSSSVHAVCINKNFKKEKITHIELDAKKDFYEKNYNLEEKANYIFQMCLNKDHEEPFPYFEKEKTYTYRFINYLAKKGIITDIKKCDDYYNYSLGDFEETLKLLMTNEELMDRFLFDDLSYFQIMDNNYVDENLPLKTDYDIFTFDE